MIIVPRRIVLVQAGDMLNVLLDSDLPGVVTWAKADGSPAWASVNAATGAVTGVPGRGDLGEHVVYVSSTSGSRVEFGAFRVHVLRAGLRLVDLIVRRPAGTLLNVAPAVFGLTGGAEWALAPVPPGVSVDRRAGTIRGAMPADPFVMSLSVRDPLGRVSQGLVRLVPLGPGGLDVSFRGGRTLHVVEGEDLHRILDVSGGVEPYSASVLVAQPWLSVSVDGAVVVLGGTVGADPTGPVDILVRDASGLSGRAEGWLVEAPDADFAITVPYLSGSGVSAIPPDSRVVVRGGDLPVTLSKLEGPASVLVSSAGEISGTFPAVAGDSSLHVRAIDAAGRRVFDTGTVSTIAPVFALTLADIVVNTNVNLNTFNLAPTWPAGTGPRWFRKESGPAWINVAGGNGRITGQAPSSPASREELVIRAESLLGEIVEVTAGVTVLSGNPLSCSFLTPGTSTVITRWNTSQQRAGPDEIVATVNVSNAEGPWTASKVSGPSWLTVDPNGNVIQSALGDAITAGTRYDDLVVRVTRTAGDATADCTLQVGYVDPPTFPALSCSISSPVAGWPTVAPESLTDFMATGAGGGGTWYTFVASVTGGRVTNRGAGRFVFVAPTVIESTDITLTVTVNDSLDATETCTATITVDPAAPLACAVPDLVVIDGEDVSGRMSSVGGSGTKTFTSTDLPVWLSLSSAGVFSGTAPSVSEATVSTFTVTVTDEDGDSTTCAGSVTVLTQQLRCSKAPDFGVNRESPLAGQIPLPTGATGTVTFEKATGPPWLNISATGAISGTSPAIAGRGTWSYTVTDEAGNVCTSEAGNYLIVPPPLLCTVANVSGFQNEEVSVPVVASGGEGGYVYALVGTVPDGLTISGSTVTLEAQTEDGTHDFTVQVTDASTVFVQCTGRITISSGRLAAAITAVTARWPAGATFGGQLAGSGGAGDYEYAVSSDEDDFAVMVDAAGVISGTLPAGIGSATITGTVTDSAGARAVATFFVRWSNLAVSGIISAQENLVAYLLYPANNYQIVLNPTISGGTPPYMRTAAAIPIPGLPPPVLQVALALGDPDTVTVSVPSAGDHLDPLAINVGGFRYDVIDSDGAVAAGGNVAWWSSFLATRVGEDSATVDVGEEFAFDFTLSGGHPTLYAAAAPVVVGGHTTYFTNLRVTVSGTTYTVRGTVAAAMPAGASEQVMVTLSSGNFTYDFTSTVTRGT